jgi:uncharacterized protein (DUF488 family)
MTIYTIGHSNIAVERFVDLLRLQLIQMLVDTRSQPYSPHLRDIRENNLYYGIYEQNA